MTDSITNSVTFMHADGTTTKVDLPEMDFSEFILSIRNAGYKLDINKKTNMKEIVSFNASFIYPKKYLLTSGSYDKT